MIQGTVNRKVHLPASAVVIGYQYYVERVFRVEVGDSFCSIFRLALVISSQPSWLIARTTTNADPKLFVHKNCTCTGPETNFLLCAEASFLRWPSRTTVSPHPTEILVSWTIYTLYACVIEKTAISSSVMREREKKSWKLLGWILCHLRWPRLHCMSEYSPKHSNCTRLQ